MNSQSLQRIIQGRHLFSHRLHLFHQYVNHLSKWKRPPPPPPNHALFYSFPGWPDKGPSYWFGKLISWIWLFFKWPNSRCWWGEKCVSNFASPQEAQTFLLQWLLCRRLGQDLKWPYRWQLEMWHGVVGTRRNVRAIQGLDFDILPFVLLSTAGDFERKAAFYFCTWPVPPQVFDMARRRRLRSPLFLKMNQGPHSLRTMVTPPGWFIHK